MRQNPDILPEGLFEKLVELMGEEKARKYIESSGYNYQAIQSKVLSLTLYNYYRKYFHTPNEYSVFFIKYRLYLSILLFLLLISIVMNFI